MRRVSIRMLLAVAAILWLSGVLLAQDSETPPALGDVARQNRARLAAGTADKPGRTQGLIDEMKQEASGSVPPGFQNYDGGEYQVFVPFPNNLEGRDEGGTVLAASSTGTPSIEVMAGTAVSIPPNSTADDLLNLAREAAGKYGQSAFCNTIALSKHQGFRCGWQGSSYLMGHEVRGTMQFVVASNTLIPVMCVSSDEAKKKQADETTIAQICDQIIYPSIQLKEDIAVRAASTPEGKAPPIGSVAGDQPVLTPEQQSPSLGELARQKREAPRAAAQTIIDNTVGNAAPAGFHSFSLQYCVNPRQCSEASVTIPDKSEVVSRVNGQHIFKAAVGGEPLMLYAGPADVNAPYRSLTDPDYIRLRDLANANGWSREKPDDVNTQELTIEGKRALLTRFRYQRDQKTWWIGERILIENREGQFLVACSAAEEHFTTVEAVCTTVLNSLRLP